MILTAILCVQQFCSFGAMLYILNLLIKTDSTVNCVPCMLEHEPFSLKSCRSGRYLMINWLNFVIGGQKMKEEKKNIEDKTSLV